MARETIERLYDDLDGSEVDVETVKFALDGRAYEIDLGPKNADELRENLAPFITAARTARATLAGTRSRNVARASTPVFESQPSRRSAAELAAVREWARDQGIAVAARGRISAKVLAAYDEAVAA